MCLLNLFRKKATPWGRIVLGGVLFTAIAQTVHNVGAVVMMDYYTNPEYYPLWSKVMMPEAGPPPASFMIYSVVFSLISALIFAYFYNFFKGVLCGDSVAKKGLCYGLILFFIGVLPGMLSTYLIINLPLVIIGEWTLEGLIISVLGAMALAKVIRD